MNDDNGGGGSGNGCIAHRWHGWGIKQTRVFIFGIIIIIIIIIIITITNAHEDSFRAM